MLVANYWRNNENRIIYLRMKRSDGKETLRILNEFIH